MGKQPTELPSLKVVLENYLEQYFSCGLTMPSSSRLYVDIVEEIEKIMIQKVLDLVGGNQVKAAKILGINRNTLRSKLIQLGLKKNIN